MAWQFFTIIPAPKIAKPTTDDVRRGAYALPLVGVMLGGWLWFVDWLCGRAFAPPVASLLALLAFSAATGFLHIDGLMDTADAVGSRKRGAEALAIMKDSRVGAMGVIAAIFLLAGKWVALTELPKVDDSALWIAPLLSRLTVMWAMTLYPAARPEGLGALFARRMSSLKVSIATAVVFFVLYAWFSPLTITVWLALIFVVVFVMGRWMVRRFGGMTGDTYGALLEMVEWLVWIVAPAIVIPAMDGKGHGFW